MSKLPPMMNINTEDAEVMDLCDEQENLKNAQGVSDSLTAEYAAIMTELKKLYYEKIKLSDAGDTLLETAPKEHNKIESDLYERLYLFYREIGMDKRSAEIKVEDWQGKIYGAAIKIKPAYDQWKSEHGREEKRQ